MRVRRRRVMTLENAVRVFAGTMVLISVILTVFVHSNFIWFTVFIGVNLIQSAYTGICPAAYFLKKFGFK
ncbi:rhodanese [Vibrio parahaemolyticus]|nr:rhodanese [Vibrio parahaemolyticus]